MRGGAPQRKGTWDSVSPLRSYTKGPASRWLPGRGKGQMTGAGLPHFVPGLDDAWVVQLGMRRDLFGHRPRSRVLHDAADRVSAWWRCHCERSAGKTGTPAPVISRACVPGGTHRRMVHPQRWPATGDGAGICESRACRKVVFWEDAAFRVPKAEAKKEELSHAKTPRCCAR